MKYKILTNGTCFKLQRKNFLYWRGLDHCKQWDRYDFQYSKTFPQLFYSIDDILDFLDAQNWKKITADNLGEFEITEGRIVPLN